MMHKNKHLDFELNLIPFIDLLSTLICFLLMTAVWMNIATVNVKQAVGGQSAAETEKKPLMWVFMESDGGITLDVRDAANIPAQMRKTKINGKDGSLDTDAILKFAEALKQKDPSLSTALIQPKAQSDYESIITLMDSFRKVGMGDLGVVPL